MSRKRALQFAIAAYVVGFVLTFGHETARFEATHPSEAEVGGLFAAFCWPVYWPLRLSFLAFEG